MYAQNAVAEAFWQQILQEHQLDASTGVYIGPEDGKDYRTERLNVLFGNMGERWVPRSLCIDLEPQTIDAIRNGPLKGLMKPDNMIKGSTGAGNNYAKGCEIAICAQCLHAYTLPDFTQRARSWSARTPIDITTPADSCPGRRMPRSPTSRNGSLRLSPRCSALPQYRRWHWFWSGHIARQQGQGGISRPDAVELLGSAQPESERHSCRST